MAFILNLSWKTFFAKFTLVRLLFVMNARNKPIQVLFRRTSIAAECTSKSFLLNSGNMILHMKTPREVSFTHFTLLKWLLFFMNRFNMLLFQVYFEEHIYLFTYFAYSMLFSFMNSSKMVPHVRYNSKTFLTKFTFERLFSFMKRRNMPI